MLIKTITLFITIASLSTFGISAERTDRIARIDLHAFFANTYYKECLRYRETAVNIRTLDFHDFDDDGLEEAIVVGSSCFTGTAGPDVHAIYKREPSGQLRELRINDYGGVFEGEPVYEDLVGNRNHRLSVEDGFLTARFHDVSGRENPLTLYYEWNGIEFALIKVVRGKLYNASFDCTRASSAHERTICGIEELADFDLELNTVYRALLARLPVAERTSLVQEQRVWLSRRDEICIPSRWLSDCLKEQYSKRVRALKAKIR